MQNTITLKKQADGKYRHFDFKVYNVIREGELVGTVESDWGKGWNVMDACLNKLSYHTTIKAAVRVAGRVL